MPEAPRRSRRQPLFSWGPLEVRERIGRRGSVEVYRAFDPTLRREVALRLLTVAAAGRSGDPPALDQALRLARVRHPNVLTVHGAETHEGRPGVWTDPIPRETLEQRARRSDPMRAEEIAKLVTDLCRGLSALHEAGIIHGDVRPAQVVHAPDGRAILLDAGAGSPGGVPVHQAPEVLEGGPKTIASDLYSVGALVYRVAAGRAPVPARSTRELLRQRGRGAILPLAEIRPDLPPELGAAIARCLARDPAARFRDAIELGNVLAAALGHPPVGSVRGKSAAPRRRLPQSPQRFVGRDRELLEVRRLVVAHPLVTLSGPGGSGKTRLALRVAHELEDGFPDGVVWMDLATRDDESAVWNAFVQSFDLRETAGRSPEEVVAEHLRGRSIVLFLDNCEHLVTECGRFIQAIRAECPLVRVVATSRVPLGLDGETRYEVGPLTVPPVVAGRPPGLEIADYEAVRLFIDRAHQVRPGFTLTRANAPAIARLVKRLDGLPLAIELAAARVKVLDPAEIDARLEESLGILRASGEGPGRQQTLTASIEWSYRLLGEAERTLLRRLAAFAGIWTAEAAGAVCRDPDEARPVIAGESIQDLLAGLCEKSLIARDASTGHGKEPDLGIHRMLETVRQFARERLVEAGSVDAVQERHLRYWVDLAPKAGAGLYGSEEAGWSRRLDWEHENLLAVLRWVRTAPQHADDAMRALYGLGRYWYARNFVTMARSLFDALLELPTLTPPLRARGYIGMALLAQTQGDDRRVREACEAALVLQRGSGDELGLSQTLGVLANHYVAVRAFDEAVRVQEEVVQIRKRLGDLPRIAGAVWNMGVHYAFAGRVDEARAAYEEALELLDRVGDVRGAAQVAANLAATALDAGDVQAARAWGSRAAQRLASVGEGLDTSGTLRILADVALADGDPAAARSHAYESLRILSQRRDRREGVRCLAVLACAAALEEEWESAARLFGAVESLRDALGATLDPGFARRFAGVGEAIQVHLGERRAADLHAHGSTLSLEQALLLAGAGDLVGSDDAAP